VKDKNINFYPVSNIQEALELIIEWWKCMKTFGDVKNKNKVITWIKVILDKNNIL
jgi:hypothetical protein